MKPSKSDLCSELEKMLKPTDYLQPSAWTPTNTTAIVDVMAHLRRMRLANLNIFGDLCYVHSQSYIDASVKDSEQARRCNCSPIDLNDVSPETPLPVTMESFWASSMNKTKLQLLLQKYILDNPMVAADIVVSAIGLAEIEPARGVFSNIGITLPELNVKIEEADVRMIPHALHSVKGGALRVILLSNDTDVVVLGLHYWSLLKGHGLKELWIRAGYRKFYQAHTTSYFGREDGPRDLQSHTATPSPHWL